ncbi:aldehyde dehydrogenase family protein [Pelagicoccus mobilis]|uniref:Aldehyde dehydrogenase family protein n=1 Tax=Pelagicoccus mobilis TaxID=415221 RepID=A0A934VQI9_9BACT|nr:aldehyde dehydrogenase family protein [Pelagicoccus mobilis]MBK1876950.1 aldehyde dehydrogenase family protein [Pelagicoccus mobilis]
MAKSLLSMATIGGKACLGPDRFDVIDPAVGRMFSSAPLCGETELEEAIASARKAQAKWSSSERNRRLALQACANTIKRNRNDLARLITREQGKPIQEAISEVSYAASIFEEYSKLEIPSRVLSQSEETRTLLLNRPFGIVGLITPWNFPIGTIAVKLAPALLAGNAVILKPSQHAPLSPLFLGKALNRALPSGILNTLSGFDELGAQIARHPAIRKLSVTGSTGTGRAVLSAASQEIKSVTLELGGNDPAIVLPDSDPTQIARELLDASWRNAGQVCSAIKRIYVHETIYESLSETLSIEMAHYKVGNGFADGVRIGPLTTAASKQKSDDYIASAYKSGAAILSYPHESGSTGNFISPKLVKYIAPDHPLVEEEQFSPILPLVSYRSIEEAIVWANRSNYGLSASVWTSNPQIGYDIAAQLECGRVGVNGHRRASASAPFGGFKQSGLGRELGQWGLCEMCETQVVNIFN